uniref:Secreted protein n=1 Tax=Ascaris lumbricoides TaxID=6252 RepID=A0A0M3IAK4_ASCLU
MSISTQLFVSLCILTLMVTAEFATNDILEPTKRAALLSRYGRAVLSRYGKRSLPQSGYSSFGEQTDGGIFLCRQIYGEVMQCIPYSR